jgi:hypothetical protein
MEQDSMVSQTGCSVIKAIDAAMLGLSVRMDGGAFSPTELGHWMGRGTRWATPTTLDNYKDEAAQPHIIVIITRKASSLVNRCLRTVCTIQILQEG